jgi:MFS family permease
MLFINTTAGIGVLAQASPIMQDLFRKTSVQAGLVVSFVSLFNAGGRLFWASLSDKIGRRTVYLLFFVLQLVLFLLIPPLAAGGNWLGFELALFAIFTMYGGGFSTMPAFAADCFGVESVSAIYGVILTAWSAAAIVGPLLITELSSRAKAALAPGESRVHIYDQPIHLLAGLLVLGVVLALLTTPLRIEGRATR